MKNHLIILGGMGPQASLKLHEALLSKSRKFHDGAPDSFPAILHASMQIPDFISSPAQKASALREVQHTLTQLPTEQVSVIGLACNTAHMFAEDIGMPEDTFVSMLDAVARSTMRHKIGLLASPHTIQSKLYHKILEPHGKQVIVPAASDIDLLEQIIHEVIDGKNPRNLRHILSAIADCLRQKGAEEILLGCTELPLIGIDTELPIVDSVNALADAMLAKHYQRQV